MYDGWQATIDGYAKNILAGHGNHVLAAPALHPLPLGRLSLALVLAGSRRQLGRSPLGPSGPRSSSPLGVGSRALTAAATHQRVGDALLMPVSVLLMTWVAARALWWRWRFGGVVWKGRILRDT